MSENQNRVKLSDILEAKVKLNNSYLVIERMLCKTNDELKEIKDDYFEVDIRLELLPEIKLDDELGNIVLEDSIMVKVMNNGRTNFYLKLPSGTYKFHNAPVKQAPVKNLIIIENVTSYYTDLIKYYIIEDGGRYNGKDPDSFILKKTHESGYYFVYVVRKMYTFSRNTSNELISNIYEKHNDNVFWTNIRDDRYIETYKNYDFRSEKIVSDDYIFYIPLGYYMITNLKENDPTAKVFSEAFPDRQLFYFGLISKNEDGTFTLTSRYMKNLISPIPEDVRVFGIEQQIITLNK